MGGQTYIVALGSNRRTRWGSPNATLRRLGARVVIESEAVGSRRRFANSVVEVACDLPPPQFLRHLKSLERAAGRRPGKLWGARALDLDIIGWSGGIYRSRTLTVPHPAFRKRRFVLAPLVEVAPRWRDPVTRLTVRQLLARLDRPRPRP